MVASKFDQLLKEETDPVVPTAETGPALNDAKKRKRIAALAAGGGRAEQYLGRTVTAD